MHATSGTCEARVGEVYAPCMTGEERSSVRTSDGFRGPSWRAWTWVPPPREGQRRHGTCASAVRVCLQRPGIDAGRRSDFTRAGWWVADSQTYFCKKPRMEIDCSVFYIVTAIAKKIKHWQLTHNCFLPLCAPRTGSSKVKQMGSKVKEMGSRVKPPSPSRQPGCH